jgi:hypothetical protein
MATRSRVEKETRPGTLHGERVVTGMTWACVIALTRLTVDLRRGGGEAVEGKDVGAAADVLVGDEELAELVG